LEKLDEAYMAGEMDTIINAKIDQVDEEGKQFMQYLEKMYRRGDTLLIRSLHVDQLLPIIPFFAKISFCSNTEQK